jgi:CheY-like chemotaxis protein
MANKRRKKILVVDRSQVTLNVEAGILRRARYQVLTATDGKQAVERALSENPDLIVIDALMPKMEGFEACRRLRQEERTQSTPIIFVTREGESVEVGFDSGCNDFLTKPINDAELLTKLKVLLGE